MYLPEKDFSREDLDKQVCTCNGPQGQGDLVQIFTGKEIVPKPCQYARCYNSCKDKNFFISIQEPSFFVRSCKKSFTATEIICGIVQ